MADGHMWLGQCESDQDFASLMVGQSYGGGTITYCVTPQANSAITSCTVSDGVNYTYPTIFIQPCSTETLNPGDLGVTVEITGAVLLLALGMIAGLLS